MTLRFFNAPQQGREILAGFSFWQRIGKGARTRLWLGEEAQLEAQQSATRKIEWAAIRAFELFQEGDNLCIDDLEVTDLRRSMLAHQRMRGGGYRLVIATLGRYRGARGAADDLTALDARLQEEISRLIHFLYLDEASAARCTQTRRALEGGEWSCAQALPHLAQTLSARALFKPEAAARDERVFFEILQSLPARHIVHETALGLTLPDATKERNQPYIAKAECRASAFFGAIGACLGQELPAPHPRAHGDRLTAQSTFWAQKAAHFLAA